MFTSLAQNADLLPGEFLTHRQRNYNYMMELTTDNLLLHYRHEAGLIRVHHKLTDCHWGWDGPLSDLRGQMTGHWLSAAAKLIHTTGDAHMKVKADYIVSEIRRCQLEHGGGWSFPIPEKHLLWLKRGKHTWAPQYVCHKCMMGLLDMYRYAGNEEALTILRGEAEWFYRYTGDISRELMDEMMDWEETGGMMELWADLYAVTGEEKHLALMRRYERPRLFEPVRRGEDILTNMHANTTIAEILGAARGYEVTGEERYREIAKSYWDLAVTQRGIYATGGQTCGELWTPMQMQSARLSDKNQEHCVVYLMIRLADFLLRWTGEAEYADYIERNLWNGLLSQAHWREDKNTEVDCDCLHWKEGLVAYYQPLTAGSEKRWATKTENFWCCVDTMLQANTIFHEHLYYMDDNGLAICQYHGGKLRAEWKGTAFSLESQPLPRTFQNIRYDPVQREVPGRPEDILLEVRLKADGPLDMRLRIRKPWWLSGAATLTVNGEARDYTTDAKGFFIMDGPWRDGDVLRMRLPKALNLHALPDEPDTYAFLDGPIVLAGLCEDERTLYGDPQDPASILRPEQERQWQDWLPNWKTREQPVNIKFRPLYRIGDEKYTVYFPIRTQKMP